MPCMLPAAILLLSCAPLFAQSDERPNIIWIVSEDASAHIGCYGERTIQTPHLDRMAAEGVRFTRAFVTCPVCSPSRSAMVSGMFQTTLGAHNHRSQRASGKGGGNESYVASYNLPDSIRLIPQLFKDAGYYVVNGGKAKTDYNFIEPPDLYDSHDWSARAKGQPFFAQVQLHGGKNRRARVTNPVDPNDVHLPPYYPDDPLLREDWARYLNSWLACDQQVGELFARLKQDGDLENTVVFFWTDHGISHARGKQFLYDEGIHVPLMARFPDGRLAGTVRDDLVSHIDVAATSLALAGIDIPAYLQGRSLFAADNPPRSMIFAARDRCDETPDLIRCVRTPQFKYIRNFFAHLSHMQPNQYKDGKDIVQRMRELYASGQLTELEGQIFAQSRPPEELYDLLADPHETVNLLAADDDRQRTARDTANTLRHELYEWMVESGDVGLIPEPILEELGRQRGSKYQVRQPDRDRGLMVKLFDAVDASESRDVAALELAARAEHPAVRWWAATGLGLSDDPSAVSELQRLLQDEWSGVRVAAAESLCRLGDVETGLPILVEHVNDRNLVVGMYAIRGLEQLGERARPALPTITAAQSSSYDFTRRIATRIGATLAP